MESIDSLSNGLSDGTGIQPIELSFPLPHAPTTRVHLHLTEQASSLIVFLTTVSTEGPGSGLSSLGSFVYAMPDVSLLSFPQTETFEGS